MTQRSLVISCLLFFLLTACQSLPVSIGDNLRAAAKPVRRPVAIPLAGVSTSSNPVWSPTGTHLAIDTQQANGAQIYLIDWASPARQPVLLDQGSKAAFSGDGALLFVLEHDAGNVTVVRAWEVAKRTRRFEWRVPKLWATEMVASQHGDRLALASDTRPGENGGQVQLFDTRTQALLFTQNTAGTRTHVGLDGRGEIVAVQTESSCARGATGLDLQAWQRHERLPTLLAASETTLAFSPKTNLVAVGYGLGARCLPDGGEVWLFDTKTRQRMAILPRFKELPRLTFSPDGAFLLVYEQDTTRIWDVRTWAEVNRLAGESRWVYGKLSPDWTWAATVAENQLTLSPFVFKVARTPGALPAPAPLLVAEDFAAYSTETVRTTYPLNNAGGANAAELQIVKTAQQTPLAMAYHITRGAPNQNYVMMERCFTPAQRWAGAHFLEAWVANDNTQPVTLVIQFGEGARCGAAPFTGEVWKSTVTLQPGERRPLNVMLVNTLFSPAGFAPTQNHQIDLAEIGYLGIGLESDKPSSGVLRVGAIRLWP